MVVEKIDSFGKVGWMGVTLVAFWLAWPIGLMLIAFLAGSGRLQAWRSEGMAPGTWFNLRSPASRSWRAATTGTSTAPSGNKAFDDYRELTIRRLEEEEQEFQSYLERLRKARDKAEFDAFMAERRQRQAGSQDIDTAPHD